MPKARLLLAAVAASVALLAVAPGAEAAAGTPRTSVINGAEAGPGSFPYLAFVQFDNGAEIDLCSGTVVSSNVVLTAAHCVMSSTFGFIHSPANFAVVTGNVNWASPQRTVSTVSRIAVDPNLAWLTSNYIPVRGDAAVLQLSAPVAAPPVRLATAQTWAAGSAATMVGWGLTTPNGPPPSTLHVGEEVVQSPLYCSSQFSRFESAATLCAVDYPAYRYATCHGDSGGPLLTVAPGTSEPLQIGITSWGSAECSTEEPQFYTRADYVAPWVAQKVAEWAPPAPAPPPAPTTTAPTATTAPSPTLPRMSRSAATGYARSGLAEGLGYRFDRRFALQIDCTAATSVAQRCGVSWQALAYGYRGTVTVYYAIEAGKVVWRYRYRIERLPSRCYRGCHPVVFSR
jgi:trypsin